jgi:hypothetical protein
LLIVFITVFSLLCFLKMVMKNLDEWTKCRGGSYAYYLTRTVVLILLGYSNLWYYGSQEICIREMRWTFLNLTCLLLACGINSISYRSVGRNFQSLLSSLQPSHFSLLPAALSFVILSQGSTLWLLSSKTVQFTSEHCS